MALKHQCGHRMWPHCTAYISVFYSNIYPPYVN